MEWKNIAGLVGKSAPLLGGILGGPVGAGIGGLLASALGVEATPDAVQKAIASDPAAAAKLAEVESNNRVALQALAIDQSKAELQAQVEASGKVNDTIQSEGKAEHWPTYSWRPFIGFCVGGNVLASSVLVVVVYFGVVFGSPTAAQGMSSLPGVLGALAAINATVLPILGIASWFRGKAQEAQANMTPGAPDAKG